MEGDITKCFKQYKSLEVQNDIALRSLSLIRTAFQNKDTASSIESYVNLIKAVHAMAKDYFLISERSAFKRFYSEFVRIEKAGGSALEDALAEIDLGRTPEFDLTGSIDGLNYEDQEGKEGFDNCQTMHDLVRCLHGAAIARVVDKAEKLPGTEKRFFYDGSLLILAREDEQKNGDLVDGICDVYQEGISKKGTEKSVVVLMEDEMYVRCGMGCHLSYLDVSLSEGHGSVNLKFVNTDPAKYINAQNRQAYVEKVMAHLGFEGIESKGIITTGRKMDIRREDLRASIKETMRLLVSTRDLDNSGYITNRVDEAVEAFIKGETNIFNYLSKPK
jgi:hypothetical protein